MIPSVQRTEPAQVAQSWRIVGAAGVEIDHTHAAQSIHVLGRVDARAAARYGTDSSVRVLDFAFEGRCGFAATFDYRSHLE